MPEYCFSCYKIQIDPENVIDLIKIHIIFDNFDFENVNFSYPNSYEKNLKDININIKKGDKVGVTGKTGSGKSTFINLFCGLLHPTEGRIKINGNRAKYINLNWKKKIKNC